MTTRREFLTETGLVLAAAAALPRSADAAICKHDGDPNDHMTVHIEGGYALVVAESGKSLTMGAVALKNKPAMQHSLVLKLFEGKATPSGTLPPFEPLTNNRWLLDGYNVKLLKAGDSKAQSLDLPNDDARERPSSVHHRKFYADHKEPGVGTMSNNLTWLLNLPDATGESLRDDWFKSGLNCAVTLDRGEIDVDKAPTGFRKPWFFAGGPGAGWEQALAECLTWTVDIGRNGKVIFEFSKRAAPQQTGTITVESEPPSRVLSLGLGVPKPLEGEKDLKKIRVAGVEYFVIDHLEQFYDLLKEKPYVWLPYYEIRRAEAAFVSGAYCPSALFYEP